MLFAQTRVLFAQFDSPDLVIIAFGKYYVPGNYFKLIDRMETKLCEMSKF